MTYMILIIQYKIEEPISNLNPYRKYTNFSPSDDQSKYKKYSNYNRN